MDELTTLSRQRAPIRLTTVLTYVFLTALAVTMVFPFVWMLRTAFIDPRDVSVSPEKVGGFLRWLVPASFPHTENFADAVEAVPFGRAYINSIIVSSLVTFGQVFTSSLAAFAFARLKFPGRDKLFLAYLATMMIPGSVTMIPVFIFTSQLPLWFDGALSWLSGSSVTLFSHSYYMFQNTYMGRPVGLDSYFTLIVPGMFSAYGTFLLRQFFMSIEKDYEEAARIDGASTWGIYWRIMLPLSRPALATLAIFTFMGSWRAYMWPLIVTYHEDIMTLPILIRSFQGQYRTEWTLLMAASIMHIIPLLIAFIIGQKYFIRGVRIGGIKG
ncbi:MAG: carbohydrate ABC transporter permease [Phycisphaerae bacterium]|nr:carbohydrate ABC transporter permease [Phycisphaerae bacterium]